MSARLETIFVKTKYNNPPIAILPLIFSNCFSFLKIPLAFKLNLEAVENKNVLVNSKLKKFFTNLYKILFQTQINKN